MKFFSGQSVEILVLRTVKCSEDSRVSKMLYHYEKLGIRVGISCISIGQPCSRISSSLVSHRTLNLSWANLDSISSRLVRRMVFGFRLLRFILHVRAWKSQVIHGCDLDGYLAGKIAFPRHKIIFEVYDPWSTMTQSRLVTRLESRAFSKCDVLIMPALDARIKVKRDYQIALSNALDTGLADELLLKGGIHPVVSSLIEQGVPYILTGGILGANVGSRMLAEAIAQTKSGLHLVVASDNLDLFGVDQELFPNNIHFIGKQSWCDWLALVKSASALWVYYNRNVKHFESHISPNKYWEAAFYEIPIIVNSMDQFCDRTPLEPKYFEVNTETKYQLEEAFLGIVSLKQGCDNSKVASEWLKMESQRRELIIQALLWLGLEPKNHNPSSLAC